MIQAEKAFELLASQVTDELVVTGIAWQCGSWYKAKHRPENLYMRGPMGLAPSVGLGVALAHPDRRVICIEGDGTMLMGLSSLAAIAQAAPPNYLIAIMDNGIYEAVGKGITCNAGNNDFVSVAKGLGIKYTWSAQSQKELITALNQALKFQGLGFLHVVISGRSESFNAPKLKPYEMKHQFLGALHS
jgi:sulfopyruvate decarboxylase subunit beta